MKKILAVCALLCLPFSALAAESYSVLFKTQGTFQDVRDSLQMAIEGKGLKITNTNKIAAMLERTGKDIGETRLCVRERRAVRILQRHDFTQDD